MICLRASPCASHPLLSHFDALQRRVLGSIANCDLSDLHWIQASLPVRCGGLGIRSVDLLAPSAFLASAASTLPLQSSLLPVNFPLDTFVEKIHQIWSFRYNSLAPRDTAATKQRSWDEASIRDGLAILTDRCTDDVSKARLLASQAPHSGDWLNAMPVGSCGLRLDNKAIRVAIGLRLGVNLCAPHVCPCGAAVDALGIHGLSCRKSAGRFIRRSMLNDLLTRPASDQGSQQLRNPKAFSLPMRRGRTEFPWFHGGWADALRGMWRAQTLWQHHIVSWPLSLLRPLLNELLFSSISNMLRSRQPMTSCLWRLKPLARSIARVRPSWTSLAVASALPPVTPERLHSYTRECLFVSNVPTPLPFGALLWRVIWTTRGGLHELLWGFVSWFNLFIPRERSTWVWQIKFIFIYFCKYSFSMWFKQFNM